MNSRFRLVNDRNKREHTTNILNKTRGKPTINNYQRFKDNSKSRLSKSNFPDSDDDCIITDSADKIVNRISSIAKTNRFASSLDKNCFYEKVKPLNFKPGAIHRSSEEKLNSLEVKRNASENQFTNVNSEKIVPSSFQLSDSDNISDETNVSSCIDKDGVIVISERSAPSGVYHTAEERYKLLEDLDNCIVTPNETLKLDRPSLAGTCLDMCPEKERYCREHNDNISIFEKDDNDKFDHNRAVKYYERCSADQKEPQPYELRTTEVLERTMNYILKFVVDSNVTKVSWRQWYKFVWTRTRSIRKDIIQQNLCNLTVIKIVEIITRFHIFCAERLCEESKDDFENHTNEENLKNCLQSLKDMYGDMPRNSCRNEAEFRSYMMIMNIDKAETLDEIHKLSTTVLWSHEVRFAIRVYQTVQTDNYVRFFRLIQSADFITSCLMHRFIASMRLRAFRVINKAYVVNKSGENQVPLGYFTRVLGFEDMEEAGNFCKRIGLTLEGEPPNIVLNGFVNMPDNLDEFAMRSYKLVEMKQGNQKLSNLFCRDDELDLDIDFPQCRMLSFSDRSRYIGNLYFPANKVPAIVAPADNVTKFRHIPSKDNFDLSDSDYKSVPKSSRIIPTVAPKIVVASPPMKVTQESRYTDLFSSGISTSNIFKADLNESGESTTNHLFGKKIEISNAATKTNIFAATPGLFSKPVLPEFTIDTDPATPCNNSLVSNEPTNVSFYLEDNQDNISSQYSEPDNALSDEDINDIVNVTESELVNELLKEVCEKSMEAEHFKTVESKTISDRLIYETMIEDVAEFCIALREEYKAEISNEYMNSMLTDVSNEYCQKIIRTEISHQHRSKILKRVYFKNWQDFAIKSINNRKSFAKFPAAPQMVDDFTICEGFRGKVRKISTAGFVSADVHSKNHPIIMGLEQCVAKTIEHLPRKVVKQNILTQTNVSYSNIVTVTVDEYIRQQVQDRFLKVLSRHYSVLEFAKQVDPTPETMISDYNNIVDSINSSLEKKGLTSIASIMKLPLICLIEKPVAKWTNYIQKIFMKLDIPQRYRNSLLEEIYEKLKTMDNSQELPELSYYHIRRFPWIRIIQYAVTNRLSLVTRQVTGQEMEVDTDCQEFYGRLQLENTLDGLSLETCRQECVRHSQSYLRRIVKSPTVKNPRRLSVFKELMNTVVELQKKIDECK